MYPKNGDEILIILQPILTALSMVFIVNYYIEKLHTYE